MKKSKSIIPNRESDVRPLNQRESKMDTRKGMLLIEKHHLKSERTPCEQLRLDQVNEDILLPNCVDNPLDNDCRPAYAKKLGFI